MAKHDAGGYWFPSKRYGWGWGAPRKWQGWLSLFIYLAAVVASAILFPPGVAPLAFTAYVGLASLLFFALCWLKGEPPRWSWGGK